MSLRFVVRRLLVVVPTVLALLTLVFLAVRVAPGDPARLILGDLATPAAIETVRAELYLDRPIHEQYVRYIGQIAQGDLGFSLRTRQPVAVDVMRNLPHSMILAVASLLLATVIGVPIGVVSAVRRNSGVDYALSVVSLIAYSMPVFWLAMLLILLLAAYYPIFPMIGAGTGGSAWTYLRHLVLPATALGLTVAALVARITRSSVLDVLRQDYVRTARAKGLSKRAVLYNHVLRNAALSIITVVSLSLGTLLGGTVLVETVFSRPGLGKLLADALFERDYPVVQGTIIVFAALIAVLNLVVDVVYAWVDPRIQYD